MCVGTVISTVGILQNVVYFRHVELTEEDKERLRGSYKVAKKLEKLENKYVTLFLDFLKTFFVNLFWILLWCFEKAS